MAAENAQNIERKKWGIFGWMSWSKAFHNINFMVLVSEHTMYSVHCMRLRLPFWWLQGNLYSSFQVSLGP